MVGTARACGALARDVALPCGGLLQARIQAAILDVRDREARLKERESAALERVG